MGYKRNFNKLRIKEQDGDYIVQRCQFFQINVEVQWNSNQIHNQNFSSK